MSRQRRSLIIFIIIVVVAFACVISLAVSVASTFGPLFSSGFAGNADQQFGDQHLKTVVALVELHKVRYGSYPAALSDLKFTGDWDQLALSSVSYIVSKDRKHYYVEVERGWIGKPTLTLPAEYWQGTGYDPTLKKSTP